MNKLWQLHTYQNTSIPQGDNDYMLCYQASDLHLFGYSDADWGGELDPYKLTSSAISWSSKKQSCIGLSTMELEYVAYSVVVQEVVWLRRFITELGIVARASEPVTIHCDNMAALAYAKHPKYHGKTKQLDIRPFYSWYGFVEWGGHEAHFYKSHGCWCYA